MKTSARNGMVILVFIGINWYLGIYLVHRFALFRHRMTPVHMEVMRESPPRLAGAIDVDEDGEDELFFSDVWGESPNRQQISVFEPFEKTYQTEFYGQIIVPDHYVFFDTYYDQDAGVYIFRFLELNDGVFFIQDVDNRQNPRETIPLQCLKNKPAGKTGFKGPFLADLDANGEKELVVILKSIDYSPPRGVACFSPKSGKLLWEYYSGTGIEDVEFMDIDNDGKQEIILSTYACNQGYMVNENSDDYSYAMVLDSNGKERWRQKIGIWGTYTHSIAADVDNDGRQEIVCAIEYSGIRVPLEGIVVIFDARTGIQKKIFSQQPLSFSKPSVLKFSAKETHIYIGDSTGRLWVFDKNLNTLNKIKLGAPFKVLNVSSSNDRWDFVFTFSQGKLMAFDKDLDRKVFSFEFERPKPDIPGPEESVFIPLCTKRGNYALIKYDKLYILNFSTLSFKETFQQALKSGWPFILITLILFNSFWIYSMSRLRIFTAVHSQEKTTVETSRFLDIARGIAHQLKNPLSTILWTAEKIKRSAANKDDKDIDTTGFSQLAEFLMEDVKILKQQTNHLLKLIQVYKPCFREMNLKSLLQGLVNHYQSLVSEKITIRLAMDENITLSIDDRLIKEALVNLLDNAIDAMPGGGQLRISAIPVTSPVKGSVGEVLMEVEDTGGGMEEEDLAKLFTPFFTKKEKGTGLGLVICKRIIEAHDGTINVHSRKGFGTKIAITIPVKTKKGGKQ